MFTKNRLLEWKNNFNNFGRFLRLIVTCGSTFLVLVDVVSNNWEINDYIGNGQTFFTPLLNIANENDLIREFHFATGYASFQSTSNLGKFMLNYTLNSIRARDGRNYIIHGGVYPILSSSLDLCKSLIQSYDILNTTKTIRLGLVLDSMQFARGNALSYFFHGLNTPPSPGTNADTLIELGYQPSRMDSDARFTSAFSVPSIPNIRYTANISMYRYFSRAFCTGCDPIVELGLDTCNIKYLFNSTTNLLHIQSSKAASGKPHLLGMMFQRTSFTIGSLILRGLCVLIAFSTFLTCQKTIRWADPLEIGTWSKRFLYLISPKYYRFKSHLFGFTYICFNSDIFVIAYSMAVLMDERQCVVFARILTTWGQGETSWSPVRVFAMNFRWIWLNCFLLKILKLISNLIHSKRYCGQNYLVGFYNFSNIIFIYIGGIFLFQRTNYNQYGLRDTISLSPKTQTLDGITIDFFNSSFMRNYPGLILCLLINLHLILIFDHFMNYDWWSLLLKNSLGRQNMYNSTSILINYEFNFKNKKKSKIQFIVISVRELCTIQWFLMCHTIKFGLPEHPKFIRDMATKGMTTNGSPSREKGPNKRLPYRRTLTHINNEIKNEQLKEVPEEQVQGEVEDAVFMIVQDQDGFLHLFNSTKTEILAASMEPKINSNARYTIA